MDRRGEGGARLAFSGGQRQRCTGLALPSGTVNPPASSEVVEASGQAQASARRVTDVSGPVPGEPAHARDALSPSETGPLEGGGARRWDGQQQLVVLAA